MLKELSRDFKGERYISNFDIFQNNSEDIKKKKIIKLLGIKLKKSNKQNSMIKGKWGEKEHLRFLKICLKYGNNWSKVLIN